MKLKNNNLKKILYLLLLVVIKNFVMSEDNLCSEEIRVLPNKNEKSYDLIEFIQQGKSEIQLFNLEKKAIMVMGLSGTGKSTLVNYLNDVELICTKRNSKWVLEVENSNKSLPGGFSIGHETKSQTLYPAAYTPPNRDYSYIDNPGFSDNRGLGVEIANSAFRKEITQNITDLKFLILVKHEDLKDRANDFVQSLNSFTDFIGIFNTKNALDISKSIAIIVSRVDNDGHSDDEIKENMKEIMINVVNDNRNINNEKTPLVFSRLLSRGQIELFSNPKAEKKVDNVQKLRILKLIEKLEYIKKDKADLLTKISEGHQKLISYTIQKFKALTSKLDKILSYNLDLYLSKSKNDIKDCHEAGLVYNELKNLYNKGAKKENALTFINSINEVIMNATQKEEFLSEFKTLTFFLELLPQDNKGLVDFERNWLNDDILASIQTSKKYLVDYFKINFENFQKSFLDFLQNYINTRTREFNQVEDMLKFEKLMQNFLEKLNQKTDFGSFLSENLELFEENIKNEIISQKILLNSFLIQLQDENRAQFEKRTWIDSSYLLSIKNTLIEIKEHFSHLRIDFDDNVFTYKGNLIKISSILSEINKSQYTKVKSIRILSANFIIFDEDFKLSEDKYEQDAADLIIISPNIKFLKNLTVDLSNSKTPDYPGGLSKAKNGVKLGENGGDGMPGEPGYSGGNFFIFSGHIENYDYLNFISDGGVGGPGQNGSIFFCCF
jgi:energy-coupling factor transporter ATP-binding protein EcfA2